MPAIANPKVLFLFEDEVREAGRRLATLRALRASESTDDDAICEAMVAALNVCMAALAGAENGDACLLMVRKTDLGLTPNVRAKRATTAGRQARAGENVPRTTSPGLVACRWRSA